MTSYKVGERVGRGGMAEVYLAHQVGMGGFEKLVVIKRLTDRLLSNPRYVMSFLREARVSAAMNHPNIVSTTDVGQDEQSPYLVMEYLAGESLAHMTKSLRRRGECLPLDHVHRIVGSVASALEYAHDLTFPDGTRSAVVHCDVTPSNIMCCYSGDVKLLDFGIARVMREEHTRDLEHLQGKMGYVAPERALGNRVSPRMDVFQLGVVLWEMLTMQHLFAGDNDVERLHAIVRQPIPAPSSIVRDVPADLEDVVMWCLRRNPDERCPSARTLAQHLRHCTSRPSTERDFALWMQATFSERRAWRSKLEQRARQSSSHVTLERTTGSVSAATARVAAPPPLLVLARGLMALALLLALLALAVSWSVRPMGSEAATAPPASDALLPVVHPIATPHVPSNVLGPEPAPQRPQLDPPPAAHPPEPRPATKAPEPTEPPPADPSPEQMPPSIELSDNLDPWAP